MKFAFEKQHMIVSGIGLEHQIPLFTPSVQGVRSAWIAAALRSSLHPLLVRGPVSLNNWLDALIERGSQELWDVLVDGLLERSAFWEGDSIPGDGRGHPRLPAYRWLDAETISRPPWTAHGVASSFL